MSRVSASFKSIGLGFGLILLSLPACTWAGALSLSNAESVQASLIQLASFSDGMSQVMMDNYIDSCTNHSRAYKAQCEDISFPASNCKITSCTAGNQSSSHACTSTGGSWSELNAPDSTCCTDGRKECGGSCCPVCLNRNHASYSSTCTLAGRPGLSVCGSTQGHCYQCVGSPGTDDQSSCESGGTCSAGVHRDRLSCLNGRICANAEQHRTQSSCENSGHNWTAPVWTPNVWRENARATTKNLCRALDRCAYCAGAGSTITNDPYTCDNSDSSGICWDPSTGAVTTSTSSKSSCQGAGRIWNQSQWTLAPQYTTETLCQQQSNYKWQRMQKWSDGTVLPATPVAAGSSCSTGPEHTEPSHVLLPGINATPFLADAAAGKSAQQAMNDSSSYYRSQVYRAYISKAVVTNHANARMRAKFSVTSNVGLAVFWEARNKGELSISGTSQTHIIVVRPTNYADADAISCTGGNFFVLGGTSAGDINITTPDKIRVWGVQNSGPIRCSRSQDIVIASVVNKVGAAVHIIDGTATLIDVTNHGAVHVHGPANGAQALGGVYKAYRVVNKGSVTINAGSIEIHTICPSNGSIIISTGVTGTVTYETGCKGTISAPAGVAVTEQVTATSKSYEVAGDLRMVVSDTSFMSNAIKKRQFELAAAKTVASLTGVMEQQVVANASLASRRLSDYRRELASGSIKVDYTITLQGSSMQSRATTVQQTMASTSSSVIQSSLTQTAQAEMGSSAPGISSLQASVQQVREVTPTGKGTTSGAVGTSITGAAVIAFLRMLEA